MAENQPLSTDELNREARRRLATELRAQAANILKLSRELAELQLLHAAAEQRAFRQWDEVVRAAESAVPAPKVLLDAALEAVLAVVRAVMACTTPDQVFQTLTEAASHWGVRAAIFDVRGDVAWGVSARGFGPAISENLFRSLFVQLNQDTPFRQVCETARAVDATAETLRKNRGVLDQLKPFPESPVLLLPIRSAGMVSAILYADSGDRGYPIPVNALKILAEFAGAQIDRLIALSGGLADDGARQHVAAAVMESPRDEFPMDVAAESLLPAEAHNEECAMEEPHAEEILPQELSGGEPLTEGREAKRPIVQMELEGEERPAADLAPMSILNAPLDAPTSSAADDVKAGVQALVASGEPALAAGNAPSPADWGSAPFSEAGQKAHQDAKRFAKLLISEIDLYNKGKVAAGREHHDLYKRLKSDIDLSRQTFQRRFGSSLGKQSDYFHDELVKTLASNDSAILGPEYPGPAA